MIGLECNKIIHGNALDNLKNIKTESCDIIIVDPPYNIGKDFGNNYDKMSISEYVTWCKTWINECVRALKINGTMFVYGFSEILAYLSVEIDLPKRWLIWHYTNKNVFSSNFWQRSHESIICCWKGKPIFNRDSIREPYTFGFLGSAGKKRAKTVGRYSKGSLDTIYKANNLGALPRDVIKLAADDMDVLNVPALAGGAGMMERCFLCKTCNRVCEPIEIKNHVEHNIIKHPTQKPFELSKKLIKSCRPQGECFVLIPFVGSGSECIAAKMLGCSYLGYELNEDYIKLANSILEKIVAEDSCPLNLFGNTENLELNQTLF